ncbi:MAG: MFS transporter [Christensenellales bacterium]
MKGCSAGKSGHDAISNLLIALGCMVYFSSYVMRYSYTVSMANIVSVTALTETQAGVIGTALFFSYGVGQILSGILGDKLKPNLIILTGIIVGSACNFIFPLYNSVVYYAAVWAVNGFAQAMLWPPLVRIFSDRLSPEKCTAGIVAVAVTANAATVALYLIIPLILNGPGWKSVFLYSGIFAAVSGVLWCAGYGLASKKLNRDKSYDAAEEPARNDKKTKLWPVLSGCGMIFILLAIVCQGFLRDGVTGWFPSYVSDTFSIPSSDGILMTAVLSAAAIISIYLMKWIYRRFCKNEVRISLMCFAAAAALSVLLFVFYSGSVVLSVSCSALIVALSHGINLMLISYIPTHFAKLGIASTVSGITNACTYLGSGLSSYLFALVAQLIGWRYVILFWALISVFGAVVCAAAYRPWKKFTLKGVESPRQDDSGRE